MGGIPQMTGEELKEFTRESNADSRLTKVAGCPYLPAGDCFDSEDECMTKYEQCSIYQSRQKVGRIL